MSKTPVRTTCPYCGVGCGVVATPRADAAASVAGDEAHPANLGRLCSKGSALDETLGLRERLLYPAVDGQRTDWDSALDKVAAGFSQAIAEHGPDSVAFYVSGQMLTEDYYLANKLMKGYIGSANIDTNSRLCMSSAVVGHKRAFGGDIVPGCYEDIELADLVVITGSNLAWCHPIVYQRLRAAKAARPEMKVVVIDPRGTATCDIADLHLALAPGSDVALFNGLLRYLQQEGHSKPEFLKACTEGADGALEAAASYTPAKVAERCRLSLGEVSVFYQWFAAHEKVLTIFSQGVNQSTQGSDKVNSIINCHLLTGRIGRPGMGPFSITGQPNAMGGREVGGLASMLAAHMDIQDAAARERVQRFWASPTMAEKPGLKAVELFDALHEGRIKAVWIIATNPVVSLPDADKVRAALERCPLVVVSEIYAGTDTARQADVILPALGWGEKNGTVTNSERRISRQRAFLPAPGEARADWWQLAEVARKMGFEGFAHANPHEIFSEHAALSAFENDGARAFNIGGLADLSTAEYADLEPVQWPVLAGQRRGTERLCSESFFTPSRRARFVAVGHQSPAHALDEEYPLVLNTGRIRDQWHTMTRSGRAAKLGGHLPEPLVEMHPRDAMLWGVRDGDLVRVRTRWGAVVVRLQLSAEQARGAIFVPIHWNDQTASDARVGKLVSPEVDPHSGEPEFKHTPAAVEPFFVDWHGFLLSRQPRKIEPPEIAWWAKASGEQFFRYELAGRGWPEDWSAWSRELCGVSGGDADWLEFADPAARSFRGAWVVDDRIEACFFATPRLSLPSRQWLASLFAQPALEARDRMALLAGRPADPGADVGPVVCACFGVGRNVIQRSIDEEGCDSVEAIGACLKAGTNCGSCVPELRKMLGVKAVAA